MTSQVKSASESDNSKALHSTFISSVRETATTIMSQKNKKETISLAIDAEWDDYAGIDVCVQIGTPEKQVIYFNQACKDMMTLQEQQNVNKVFETWKLKHPSCDIQWVVFGDKENHMKRFIDTNGFSTDIEVLMFYSPKDPSLAFGFDNLNKFMVKQGKDKKAKVIDQKRCFSGQKIPVDGLEVTFHDLKGYQPQGGLAKLLESLGLDTTNKTALDFYKTHILDALIQKTEVLLDYCFGDIMDLFEARTKYYEFINEFVIRDTLGLKPLDKLPNTTGSLVAKTFEPFLFSCFKDIEAFTLATLKLGKLSESGSFLSPAFNQVFNGWERKAYLSPKDIEKGKRLEDVKVPDLEEAIAELIKNRSKFDVSAISGGAVQVLGQQQDSRAYNAIVQGGRCNNERPEQVSLDYGLDIDLGSCYGSALSAFTYPIGLPTQLGFQNTEIRTTLGSFLKKYQKDLVHDLWTVTVSGNLSFEQDLIYSKRVSQLEINNACDTHKPDVKESDDPNRDNDLAHIPGIFMLTRRVIENGIITSEILEKLERIATSQEFNQIKNLTVVSACFYKRSDRVDNDEWADVVLSSKGVFKTVKTGAGGTTDTRSTKWTGISVGRFIDPLLKVRKNVKKEAQRLEAEGLKDTQEYRVAKAKDSALKLFINTLYGVFCSIYFPVGNAVVANNITARARVGTWMMNKALWTRQSITDGGIYSPLEVPLLEMDYKNKDHKKPGLHILSDWKRWENSRNRKTTILGDLNWENIISIKSRLNDTDLDAIATKHINEFWSHYALELPFKVDHKKEHSFIRGAYLMKGHYALLLPDGETIYACRGAKDYERDNLDDYTENKRRSPLFTLLSAILNDDDSFTDELVYDHFYLLKVTKYREIQASSGYLNLRDKRPGDAVLESRTFHWNNTYCFINTPDEYVKRYNRHTSHVLKGQKVNVELFEQARAKGIQHVVANAVKDRLRITYTPKKRKTT